MAIATKPKAAAKAAPKITIKPDAFPRVAAELQHATKPVGLPETLRGLYAPATAADPDPLVATFAFALGQRASISVSGENGIVIARSEHASSEPQYLLRYKANDGRAVEVWWQGSALAAVA